MEWVSTEVEKFTVFYSAVNKWHQMKGVKRKQKVIFHITNRKLQNCLSEDTTSAKSLNGFKGLI